MEELIKINKEYDFNDRFPISHLDLSEFLGIRPNTICDYLENRRGNYEFTVMEDFYTHVQVNPNRGRPQRIYFLSFNAAKEICMLSGSPRGKEARQYFIECERKFKSLQINTNDMTIEQAAEQLSRITLQLIDEKRALENQIQKNEPKVDFYDRFMDDDRLYTIKEVADVLKIDGFGRNSLYNFLVKNKIFTKQPGSRHLPYRTYIDSNYFEVKYKSFIDPMTNKETFYTQTYVLPKGIKFIKKKLESQKRKLL